MSTLAGRIISCLTAPFGHGLRAGMAVILLAGAVAAQTPPQSIILDAQTTLDFKPERAFFVVTTAPGEFRKLQAIMIPMSTTQGLSGKSEWFFGVSLPPPERASELNYAVVVLGENGRYFFIPERKVSLDWLKQLGTSVSNLREFMLNRKTVLQELSAALLAEAGRLERVQTDAALVAREPQITELNTQRELAGAQLVGVTAAIADLEDLLESVKKGAEPLNYLKRQEELTAQLKELAGIASAVEALEDRNKTQSQEEAERLRALIAETGNESYDSLSAELTALRREKEILENKMGLSAGDSAAPAGAAAVDEYEVSRD